ncbi:MAG: helix-turn-helix transcriptional regulator [Burkholderiaceae bacterium]|nr:helix-turn-helix transcriptional regulator [Roseateles sp.]MBV8468673.1 helix-turn-helix transcriptional regulator [Burkholderiaceae bacterium]
MRADHLSATFAALADPTRRAILARLAQGEATVADLAGPFDMSAPAISKHIRVLTRAGLITQGRDRQFRPCRIVPAPLKQAADWALQYRALWEQRLDQLDSYLQQLQQVQQTPAKGAPEHAPKQTAPKTASKVSSTPTWKNRHHD